MARAVTWALAAAASALCAFLVLAPGLDSWFVADDFWHLAYARFVSTPWRSFIHPQFGDMAYRPVTFVINFFQLNYISDSADVVHAFDALIHCLNTALVLILCYLVFQSRGPRGFSSARHRKHALAGGFIAALIFGVHPVACLTASWFACRADLLATFFSLLVLVMVSGRDRPRPLWLILSGAAALLALGAKVTHLPLFLVAGFVAFAAAPGLETGKRFRQAAYKALPVLDATLVYLCIRLWVLKGLGGYTDFPESASKLWAMGLYHLPRVIAAAARDLCLHDISTGAQLLWPLLAGWALLVLAGLPGMIKTQKGVLLAGALMVLALLAPAWNLSHMFALREERLVYFPLVGFALMAASFVAGPRKQGAMGGAFAAGLSLCLTFGMHSREEARAWEQDTRSTRKVAAAIADRLKDQGPSARERRVYVLGLPEDSYFLDPMVKLLLKPSFYDREIMPADQDAFVWIPAHMKDSEHLNSDAPESALPGKTLHQSDPEVIFYTTRPGDLLLAAKDDPYAQMIEWNGVELTDITLKLKKRFYRRRLWRRRVKRQVWLLPSFTFRKNPMGLKWTPGPGLKVEEPVHLGTPYTFVPSNNDPYLTSPEISFPAVAASRLSLDMTVPQRAYLPPGMDQGCLTWQTLQEPGMSPERKVCFDLVADGKPHHYDVDLTRSVHWSMSGKIKRLRLDPVSFKTRLQLIRLSFEPE